MSAAYREADGLPLFAEALVHELGSLGLSWEVIIVDDGSPDDTWSVLEELSRRQPRIRGIRLVRNFGQQAALIAGMEAARGHCIVTMDCDLQHPPAVIKDLVARWRSGALIVQSVRQDDSTSVSWFKKATSRGFYRIFNKISGLPLSDGMADFRLIDRTMVAPFLAVARQTGFLRGTTAWLGTPSKLPDCKNIDTVLFAVAPRARGTTKYSLRKMLRLCWSGLMGFSTVPFRAGFLASGLLAILSLTSGASSAIWSDPIGKATAIIVAAIFAVGALLALLVSMVGEFVVYQGQSERQRPVYVIRESLGYDAGEDRARESSDLERTG